MSKLAVWAIVGVVIIGVALEAFTFFAFDSKNRPVSVTVAIAVYSVVAAAVVWLGDWFAGRRRRTR